MPFVSQQITNVLGGVSQAPDKLRGTDQSQAQVNVFDSIVHGKMKRPPTTHVAKLSSVSMARGTSTAPGAWIWPVNRDSSLRYHVVVNTTGTPTVQVFDATTGQQYPVLTPQGTAYLEPQVAPTYVGNFVADSQFLVGYPALTPLESVVTSNGLAWIQAPTMATSRPNGSSSGLVVVGV